MEKDAWQTEEDVHFRVVLRVFKNLVKGEHRGPNGGATFSVVPSVSECMNVGRTTKAG